MYKNVIKPILDFILSLLAVIMLAPFLVLIIISLFFINNGRVFFVQERIGRSGQPFNLVKFRTMADTANSNGVLLPDRLRVTKTGKIMRDFSIDELPQLINILAGKMSFIGPRPLLRKYLDLYTPQQARRHEVKPGLTGWAQVNGRNSITWNEKFKLDVWYVDNSSFILDTRILFMTIQRVLTRQGINSTEKSTMPAFNGKN